MKRIFYTLITVLSSLTSFSQAITVNNTFYTVPQLVQNVLFAQGSAGSSCVGTVGNITWRTGTNFSSVNGIAYFQNTNPNFPLNSGVILSTGNPLIALGPNNNTQSQGPLSWPGDTQLYNYMLGLGFVAAADNYFNATVLEFDFTPLTNQMSFDFLFASEEYGAFQCAYSDAFAFFLNNVTAGTPPVNLALVPNTTIPIAVTTIRDNANSACPASNVTYFGSNNQGVNAASSATNFNGQTTLLTANSTVIPNNVYHIKLVIADLRDGALDSAVFLGAGSFNIGTQSIVGNGQFAGISEFTNAGSTAQCSSTIINVQAGAVAVVGATYSWTLNGNPVGTNSNFYTITQAGNYGITITYPGGCQQTDTMIVEYVPSVTLGVPPNLTRCSAPFNLTNNSSVILNGTPNSISFHHTLAEAQGLASPILNPSNYPGVNGEIIYVAVEDGVTGCIITTQFVLNVDSNLCIPGLVQPSNLISCESIPGSGTAVFDFTPLTPIIIGSNNPANYNVSYHLSQLDANNDTNAISPINSFNNTSSPQTIYVRMESNLNPLLYGSTTFQLIVNSLPSATITGTTSICSGSNTVITFTGTPNATVTYTIDGGPNQTIVLNATGTNTITTPNLIANSVYNLTSVLNTATTCNRTIVGAATVTVNQQPIAGTDGTITICETNTTPIDLFSLITGEQAGGIWTRTSGAGGNFNAAAGTFIPAIGATNSTFTYTLAGTAPCINDTSVATININSQPIAGTDGTTTICETNTTPIDLFSLITGEQLGGIWTQTSGTGGTFNAVAGTFTPAIGASNSIFTYTLLGVAPCVTDTSIATINITAQPVAGTDGTTTICETNTAVIDLFSLITGEQLGGTWARTSGTGGIFTAAAGTFTPAIGATNSTFTYTLVGTAPCVTDTSIATININPQPIAGVDGSVTICASSVLPIDLFSLITGEQTGGVWTRTSGTGGTFNAVAGTFTPTVGATTSTFDYTLVGVAPCINDVSVATITIGGQPDAGVDGTTTICETDATPIDLFSLLTGEQVGGTWVRTSGTGGTFSAGAGTFTPAIGATNSTFTYTLLGVAPCVTDTSLATITINTAPTITTPSNYVVCDDSNNNDGLNCNFDFTTLTNQITAGNPNIVVTYHETLTNSQTGANPITGLYCNIDSGLQTIYVRAYTLGSPTCYTNTTFNLIINPLPLANPTIANYEQCDYTNPGDATEQFTLNTKTLEIANGQANVTVSYYASQGDATSQSNPLPNVYSNTSNPQQIWINIRNTTTGCNTVSSFTLVVNLLPAVILPDPIFECSNGSTTQALFDLTLNEAVVTGGLTGLAVTYYTTLLDAQNETNPIATPLSYNGTDNEIVYLRVENIATSCYVTTTQLLRVTQGPTAITPQPLRYCDPNNDGFGVFNLEDATAEIAGGTWPLVGVSIGYYETQTDALLGTNPSLTSPYTNINPGTQTIYVRVYYTLTGCANYVQLQLQVDPTPEATTPDDYELCDYTGAVGFESFDLTTTIPQILGNINPALTTVTFHPTQVDASADTNAISNVTNYINQTIATQTLYVRVETIATGCYDTVALNLIVNPLPNSLQPNYPQYTLCDTTGAIGFETFDLASQATPILLGQTGMSVTFYPSLTDAQNGTNAITNLQYTNTTIYVQTLGVKITNATTGCYVISTIDIRVEPLPTPIPPTQPYTICDDNQDGFAGFDLTTLIPDLLQGAVYTISFYETLSDAQLGTNPIDTTQLYNNINPFVQTLYVRAQDPITGCWSLLPIVLNVNPSPVAPVLLDNIIECDDDNNPQNAITAVDLTQRTADALALQPASGSYTVTYYTSQTAAQNGTAPIVNDTNYVGTDGQTIWVRVEDTTTGCYNIGSFELEINTPLLLITPTPLNVCDDDANPNDQYHSFDLTVKNSEIISSGVGSTVTYYPSLTDAQNNTNVITTPTAYTNITPAVQTLGVVVTTPAPANCQSITTLDIRVLPIPTPNTDPRPLPAACDNNNPGDLLEIFDLTLNAAYIANGDPNVTLHYFPTQADAQNNVVANEILTPTAALVGTTVWIRVENNRVDYQGNRCFVIVAQPLSVNPLPIVIQPLAPYRVCDNDADGLAIFDLTNPQLAITILGATQLPADYTISYYATAQGANPITNTGQTPLPSSYQNTTPNTQDIYIRVVNNTTGCVNTGILPLAVEEYALATGPQFFESCDSYTDAYDGVFQLDLTQFNTVILNGQNPAIFLISYYHTQADAMAGINAIPLAAAQAYVTTPDTDQIWVKVENSSNSITPLCYALTTIEISIERAPNPIINTANDVNTICVDFTDDTVVRPLTLDSGVANPANYTFEWFEDASTTPIAGATGPTYTVDTASPTGATRNYTVRVTSNSPLACATTSAVFPVIQSGQAVIPQGTVGYTVTNAFSEIQIITVTVEGYGTYEYSLDDGPRQTSNIFENVSLGTHVIHIWDSEGGVAFSCEELIIQGVQIIDYPHYFTPNGDGIHDTWNIVGLGGQPNAKIYIFDRYGKLIKQISSTGQGWDGTYNGYLLPSTDYWFSVEYEEQTIAKVFKAHFSLKR